MNTAIDITIRDRVPYIGEGEGVITYNSDYVIEFDFDDEWSENVKTVYFAFEDGTYKAVVIDGTTCAVPTFDNSHKRVFVGVQAGDIRTTRPCCLKILDSIADYVGEAIPDPSEDVYQQIINLINAIPTPSWDTLENKPFTNIGSGLKVEDGALTATAQGGADITITDTAEVGEVLTVEEVDSEGKPTKWKTEKPTAEQKQADWSQNDETAADYVKNRTHYDSRSEETVEKTFTLTSESAQTQKLFDDFTYDDIAKLKSIVVAEESFKADGTSNRAGSWRWNSTDNIIDTIDVSGEYGATAGSVYQTVLDGVLSDTSSDGEAREEEWSCALYLFVKDDVLSNEKATAQGVTSLGLYYDYQWLWDDSPYEEVPTFKDDFTIVRELGEFKTIEPKYIKDMYYTEVTHPSIEGYDGGTFDFIEDYYSHPYDNRTAPPLEIGQVWSLHDSTNNKDYTDLVVKGSSEHGLYIGDTGCSDPPFCITTYYYFAPSTWTGTLTGVSGTRTEDVVHPIPEKYYNEQVQADWSQTDATKKDYIKNKPDVGDVVKYTYQSLTEEQRQQARNNIGASGVARVNYWIYEESNDLVALYNTGVGYGVVTMFNGGSMPEGMTAPMFVTFGRYSYGSVDMSVIDGAGVAWKGSLDLMHHSASVSKVSEYVTSAELADLIDGMLKYTAQTLTDSQKTQARTNIGAGTSSFSGSYTDLTNKPTIPDVPEWAMADAKPTYTASEVGAVATAQGTANSGKYLAVGTDGNVTATDISKDNVVTALGYTPAKVTEEKWELVKTMAVEESVTSIEITLDEPCSKVIIMGTQPSTETNAVGVTFLIRDSTTNNNVSTPYLNAMIASPTYAKSNYTYIWLDGDRMRCEFVALNSSGSSLNTLVAYTCPDISVSCNAITGFNFYRSTGFAVGIVWNIYGVKKEN